MANKFDVNQSDWRVAKKIIDNEAKQNELKIRSGLIGRLFGSNDRTQLYIVGAISIILLIVVSIYTFLPVSCKSPDLPSGQLWGYILPVITTLVGYVFGYSQREKSNND